MAYFLGHPVCIVEAYSERIRTRIEFLEEAVMMTNFDHRNVMWLIAITIDAEMKPHAVLPFMEYGDLRSFIAKPTNVSICVYHYNTVLGVA